MASHPVDAVIAIGSVIQGETKHFDFVCSATAQGIAALNVQFDVPVIFCVLTDNTCLLYTSPSPRDRTRSRMPSSA